MGVPWPIGRISLLNPPMSLINHIHFPPFLHGYLQTCALTISPKHLHITPSVKSPLWLKFPKNTIRSHVSYLQHMPNTPAFLSLSVMYNQTMSVNHPFTALTYTSLFFCNLISKMWKSFHSPSYSSPTPGINSPVLQQ